MPVSRITFIGIAALLGFGLVATATVYVIPLAIGGTVATYYAAKATSLFSRTDWEPMYIPQLRFSVPLVVASTVSFVMGNADTFMIGYFLPSDAVGVYNIAYTLGNLLTAVLSAITFLSVPLFSELHRDGDMDEFNNMFRILTKWTVFITFPLFIILLLFPDEVISYTFGSKYAGGASALQFVAAGFFVSTLAGDVRGALSASGRTTAIMYVTVIASTVNVGLNYLLIPRFGITGAAVATGLMYTTINVLLGTFLYREMNIHPFTRQLLRPLVVVLPVVVGMWYMTGPHLVSPIMFVGLTVTFCLVYAIVLLYGGGIGEPEMMILRSIEERFDVDLSRIRLIIMRFSD